MGGVSRNLLAAGCRRCGRPVVMSLRGRSGFKWIGFDSERLSAGARATRAKRRTKNARVCGPLAYRWRVGTLEASATIKPVLAETGSAIIRLRCAGVNAKIFSDFCQDNSAMLRAESTPKGFGRMDGIKCFLCSVRCRWRGRKATFLTKTAATKTAKIAKPLRREFCP